MTKLDNKISHSTGWYSNNYILDHLHGTSDCDKSVMKQSKAGKADGQYLHIEEVGFNLK